MSRIAPYFKTVLILLVGAIVVGLANKFAAVPGALSTATSTVPAKISVLPTVTIPTTTIPNPLPQETPKATTTPSQNPVLPKKVTIPAVPATPAPTRSVAPVIAAPAPVVTAAPLAASGNAALDTAASSLRAALVNILCYAPAGGSIHSISASGVFIDSKGIILTNAHVAQYFLLADRGVSCTIRGGNPAVNEYKAQLIYISPSWVRVNASVITQAAPIGTGEYDFALLAVTKATTNAALPLAFPYVSLAQVPPELGTPVVIASYGAQFLTSNDVQTSLYPTVVFGSVKDIFTFASTTVDVLSLGGSAAAQEGSSGGGIIDASGSLVATITTSTITGSTDTRSLDAITASYIRREYAAEMGISLDLLLSEPTAASVTDFAPQMTTLETLITSYLP